MSPSDKYISIAQAAVTLSDSQNEIANAVIHVADLESVIHDNLTGAADQFLKDQVLTLTRAIGSALGRAAI